MKRLAVLQSDLSTGTEIRQTVGVSLEQTSYHEVMCTELGIHALVSLYIKWR